MSKIEIENLKSSIESSRNAIKNTRETMARQRASNAPKHYQESGKRNIEYQKELIEGYKKKIANYREKKSKNMGKGVDSFKRELGKNTGKWISNKVFGDGHSTPHSVNLKKSEISNENKEGVLSKGKEILSSVNKEIFGDKKLIKKINKKKEKIISTPVPKETDDIMNLVNLMLSKIKTNGWKSGENEKHINSFSDACLTKLEQCHIKLKSINETQQAEYVKDEIKKLKRKKIIQKYGIWISFGLMFLVGFILYKLGLLK